LSFQTISIAYDKRALDFLRDTNARADKLHDMAGHERYFENAEYTHHDLVWSFHALRHIGFERRSGEPVSQRVPPLMLDMWGRARVRKLFEPGNALTA